MISALLLVPSAALVWLAGEWTRDAALAETRRNAVASLSLHASALRSDLEKYRSVAFMLAQDTDVAVLLDQPSDPSATDRVNRKLERLAEGTRAAVLYVLDASGKTIAASNWRLTTSFVGQDYAFRTYFRAASASGMGEQFSAGTVSQRPGYYFARRTETDAMVPGIVVVKVEFDRLEAEWQRSPGHALVVDANGVVLITDEPEWRFSTLQRLPETDRDRLRDEVQYGAGAPLTPLPMTRQREAVAGASIVRLHGPGVDGPDGSFLAATEPVPDAGWTVYLLEPLEPLAARSRLSGMATAGMLEAVVVFIAAVLIYRRVRARRRLEEITQQQEGLERQVAARTAELSRSNLRLSEEVAERSRAEAALRRAQDELVQTAKLAALGQMAASIAHEVNQPLAAMRTYSDNAAVLLTRGRVEDAQANLTSISALTGRIAQITQHLKGFARKASSGLGPVSLQAAINAAVVLLEHRLRQQDIRVSRDVPEAEVRVWAEQVRLEQVLVNLVQNAMDALAGAADREIFIAVRTVPASDRVVVTVADNGPGVPADTLPKIFSAFFTTKGNGLGLGLSISQGIVRDFGGTLTCTARPGGGAAFEVELRMAP